MTGAAFRRLAVAVDRSVSVDTAAEIIANYRAELLAEVAVTVRAAAPKRLDNDVDLHVFQVLNDLAAKIARGDL